MKEFYPISDKAKLRRYVGSMSQLATKYENSFKIGLKHVW